MNIVPNIKNAYLRKYKETLYQINDKDYIASQSVKLKGQKKKNVKIYNALGKDNNNADFHMILTALGEIYNYGHNYSDFNSDWYRADENHTISCSYIGNDNCGLTNDSLLLAFLDINENELLQARNMDAGTGDYPFYSYEDCLHKNKFLLPQTMLNETKMYNEFLVERKIKKDGKLVNRKPSYAVFMAKNIEDINDKDERWQQAKKWLHN